MQGCNTISVAGNAGLRGWAAATGEIEFSQFERPPMPQMNKIDSGLTPKQPSHRRNLRQAVLASGHTGRSICKIGAHPADTYMRDYSVFSSSVYEHALAV